MCCLAACYFEKLFTHREKLTAGQQLPLIAQLAVLYSHYITHSSIMIAVCLRYESDTSHNVALRNFLQININIFDRSK